MPDLKAMNENSIASLLKGDIGKRYKNSPWKFDMPDDKTLAMLARWGKKAALQAGALGGIGYSMHLTGSADGMTAAYVRMEHCRRELEARGAAVPSWEVRARMAVVVAIILFIWGKWADLSPAAATSVVPDFLAHGADYQIADGEFPFSRDLVKAAVPVAKRILGM